MRRVLQGGAEIATSEITLVECDRVLHRRLALGEAAEATVAQRRALFARTVEQWDLIAVRDDVIVRARSSFLAEPIRALDAIHLASALIWARTGPVTVLSLDDRIRKNAHALGLDVAP